MKNINTLIRILIVTLLLNTIGLRTLYSQPPPADPKDPTDSYSWYRYINIIDHKLWGIYGNSAYNASYPCVATIINDGKKIYFGGNFGYVGPTTPNAVIADTTTGKVFDNLSFPNNQVAKAIPDGHEGWIVIGDFTEYGDNKISSIAHILSDNSVDTTWKPIRIWKDNYIRDAVIYDSLVYIGGVFKINDSDTSTYHIAAISLKTGKVFNNFRIQMDISLSSYVKCITIYEGKLYASGTFFKYNNIRRINFASWDIKTGELTNWNPVNSVISVNKMIGYRGSIYAGGVFSYVDNIPRTKLAAFDTINGNLTNWNPIIETINGYISDMIINDTILYICGSLSKAGGKVRRDFAALSLKTGNVLDLNPVMNTYSILSMQLHNNKLYVFGKGLYIDPLSKDGNGFYIIDLKTGNLIPYNLYYAGGFPYNISFSGSKMFICGNFTSYGGFIRNNIAALDIKTGKATDWNPVINGNINSLSIYKGNIYAGGKFNTVKGLSYNNLVAVDSISGNPLTWNPSVNGEINTLYISDNILYAGGSFSQVGTDTRNNFAAIDINTGKATGLNPEFDNEVNTITKNSGNALFTGGSFVNVNGEHHNYIAAIDLQDQKVLDWDPQIGNIQKGKVNSVLVKDTLLYIGGLFNTVNGINHKNMFSVNAETGKQTDWIANTDGKVNAIATSKGFIYAGGDFSFVNDKKRNGLASFNILSGDLTNWLSMDSAKASKNLYSHLNSIMPLQNKIYVGDTSYINSYYPYDLSLFAFKADSIDCIGLSLKTFGNNATCSLCKDGKAWVKITGGKAPYKYTWYTNPMQATDTARGLPQGKYHVCVTDLYGCTVCDSVEIKTGSCSAHFDLYHTSTAHLYHVVNMASGAEPIKYNWDWDDGTFDTIPYPTHLYDSAGYYKICLTIKDFNGCINTYCNPYYLRKSNEPIIEVDVLPSSSVEVDKLKITNYELRISPNPANSLIVVSCPLIDRQNTEVRIYDITGRRVHIPNPSLERNKIRIDVSGLCDGVYFVRVSTNDYSATRKIVIQH